MIRRCKIKRLFFIIPALLFVPVFFFPVCCGAAESEILSQADWDLFGEKGGWFHAYLTAGEKYSDNVYYSNSDEKSDYITLITPGLWFSVPGSEKRARNINTSKGSAGGLSLSRFDQAPSRRFHSYFFYEPYIEIYSKESDLSTINQKLEGSLQYNFRGGLSIEVLDQFIDTDDPYSESLSILGERDDYMTNLANLTLGYKATEKLDFRLDYTNFLVDYGDSRNEIWNRTDHTVTGYVYFNIRSKSAVFTGYEYTDIQYEIDDQSDNTESRYYGGFQWDITEKTRGRIKLGYSVKDFEYDYVESSESFIYELQLNKQFTEKTSLSLTAYRRDEEVDFSDYDYALTHKVNALYLQGITGKIFAGMRLWYSNESYEGGVVIGNEKREDNVYYLNPFLRYNFTEHFSSNLEYIYEERDSNVNLFDFVTNSVQINLKMEL